MLHNQEEEIKRIADELHDGVAQTLYSIYTGLQHLQNSQKSEELVQYTAKMVELTEKTLINLRKLSSDLYPQTLDNFGLYSALKSYIHHQEEVVGFNIFIKSNGVEQRFSLAKEMAIFRVCRDMIHHLVHCPKVKSIHIMVNWLSEGFHIDMQAFGKKCCRQVEEGETDLSIAAINKQIELLNGKFEYTVKSGEGLHLKLKVPIE